MTEAYNIANAVATWVMPILAFALSLATFIQSHYNVQPKYVQGGRELVSVVRYNALAASHGKLVTRVAALGKLHGKAPRTVTSISTIASQSVK
jgi:hypothetical protein